MPVMPRPDQIEKLAAEGREGAIVMVNLLKYRDKAQYPPERPEAKEDLGGREAYHRYGIVALQQIAKVGGRPVWGGRQRHVLVGSEQHDTWDEVVCIFYPSRQAFLTMTADPDYLAAHYHREAALERTALLCCDAGMAS